VAFTSDELAYLRSQPLARLATRSTDGQPDVVPVAFEYDGACFWVGGTGSAVLGTRKFRNVFSGNREVALVIDDLVSLEPFIARGIRIYGAPRTLSTETGWLVPATTCASPRPSFGAGTWKASPPATPGTK
jgi:pyridoxamine 5'-phosphate oxidase family protein